MNDSPTQTFHISFNGSQVSVVTDVDYVKRTLDQSYGPVLEAEATACVGTLSIMQAGADSVDITGTESLRWHYTKIDPLLSYIKQYVHGLFMQAHRDLLWVHAAVVEWDGRAVVLCGRSGVGKSTLSLLLCASGWRLLSDDVAPILPTSNVVLPFYQGATRRISPGRFLEASEVGGLPREEIILDAGSMADGPSDIASIVFPSFQDSVDARLTRMRSGDAALELVRNVANLPDQKDEAVWRACRIVESVPAFSLGYGNQASAIKTLARLSKRW
jgi:hypothetical protein